MKKFILLLAIVLLSVGCTNYKGKAVETTTPQDTSTMTDTVTHADTVTAESTEVILLDTTKAP